MKKCVHCGQSFTVSTREDRKRTGNQKYCSDDCARLSRAEANKRRMNGRTSIKCEICKKWTRIRFEDQEEHGSVCAACRQLEELLQFDGDPEVWYPHDPWIGTHFATFPPDAPGGLICPAL